MSSLSLDTIASLLGDPSLKPKPKQIGPLRYNTVFGNCCRCGVMCGITINGEYYCSSHGLYALNLLCLGDAITTKCTCTAGSKTDFNLHTPDCAMYDKVNDNAR